jgi:hypothetical protein
MILGVDLNSIFQSLWGNSSRVIYGTPHKLHQGHYCKDNMKEVGVMEGEVEEEKV